MFLAINHSGAISKNKNEKEKKKTEKLLTLASRAEENYVRTPERISFHSVVKPDQI